MLYLSVSQDEIIPVLGTYPVLLYDVRAGEVSSKRGSSTGIKAQQKKHCR